jgi:glycosyltransferase involved in cell wall biosynthesis
MTESPLVSIVIPAFNHGHLLADAIESVLHQHYRNIELIVIDDGSTDDTSRVLSQYEGRLYYERQANSGQARALERGWSVAKGSILGYLSADDVLYPPAVASAAAVLADQPHVVLTYSDYDLISPDSTVLRHVTAPELSYSEMVLHHVCAPGPGAFFRRASYLITGPWNASFSQIGDFEYWMRLGRLGTFHRIPEVLAGLRVHRSSQSFAPMTIARAQEPLRVIESVFDDPTLPADIRARAHQAVGWAHAHVARSHFRAARYWLGAKHLWSALRSYPQLIATFRAFHLMANGLLNRPLHLATWSMLGFLERHSLRRGPPRKVEQVGSK